MRKNALEAHREVETVKSELSHLEDKQEGLKRDIATLETKKETLSAEDVAELKGTKTITGGLKGVTFKEYQVLKATAADNLRSFILCTQGEHSGEAVARAYF